MERFRFFGLVKCDNLIEVTLRVAEEGIEGEVQVARADVLVSRAPTLT
ncbi:hypothetical protein [Nonomuraea sp. JJY05]